MSYEYQPTDWSKFEASREEILRDQDIVQATIDESMRRGDLFEAGVACLDHVLTSYDLGDQKEGASYLAMGIALSTAGTFAVPEHLRHKSAEDKTFEIPEAIQKTPFELAHVRSKNGVAIYRDSGVSAALNAIEEIEINLCSAETLINNEFCSASNKNQAIHDTVKSIGDFYFNIITTNKACDKENEQIVQLVKELAENIEVDDNPTNHRLAFDTYRRLMLLATHIAGKTNSALSFTSRGFKELAASTNDEFIREASQRDIKTIRLTQIARLASAPTAISKNAKEYIMANDDEWHRMQVSKGSRHATKGEYTRIELDSKLYKMHRATKNRLNPST